MGPSRLAGRRSRVPRQRPPLDAVRIQPSRHLPTAAEVRATLERLGLAHAWTDEAIRQLLDSADALARGLPRQPQDPRLLSEPAAVLQILVDEGRLTTPVDAVLAALRAQGAASPAQAGAPAAAPAVAPAVAPAAGEP